MDSGINLLDLPHFILEEIFSYLRGNNLKHLCLVNKSLNNIIKQSPKVMRLFKLNVTRMMESKSEFNDYSNFAMESFVFEDIKDDGICETFATNYKHKSRVKWIELYDTETYDILIKSIKNFSNFESLQKLTLYFSDMIPNIHDATAFTGFEKLKILEIEGDEITQLVNMFSNIPIESIQLCDNYEIDLSINENVNWKLKNMNIGFYLENCENNFNFLKKQNATLKVLKLQYAQESQLNFIMRYLTNLEVLEIEVDDEYMYDDDDDDLDMDTRLLLSNTSLKTLEFKSNNLDELTPYYTKILIELLKHYKYIEILKLSVKLPKENQEFKNIKLPNLKEIYVDTPANPLFKGDKMNNLKSVGFYYKTTYKDISLTDKNFFENVEELYSYYTFSFNIFKWFPSLRSFKLGTYRVKLGEKFFNRILKTSSLIEKISISDDRDSNKAIRETILQQTTNKNLKILLGTR